MIFICSTTVSYRTSSVIQSIRGSHCRIKFIMFTIRGDLPGARASLAGQIWPVIVKNKLHKIILSFIVVFFVIFPSFRRKLRPPKPDFSSALYNFIITIIWQRACVHTPHALRPESFAILPTFAHRLFDKHIQFGMVRDPGILGIPLNSRIEALGQNAQQDDLRQIGRITEI